MTSKDPANGKSLHSRLDFIDRVLSYECAFLHDIIFDPARGWTDPVPADVRKTLRELVRVQHQVVATEIARVYSLSRADSASLQQRLATNRAAFEKLLGDPDPEPSRLGR